MKLRVILFLCVLVFCTQGRHWSGNILYDLELQGFEFVKEAEEWITNGPSKTTQCSSDTLLGGPIYSGVPLDTSWVRSYANLPPHLSVTLQAKLYLIDSWDQNSISFRVSGPNTGESYNGIGWRLTQLSNPAAVKNFCGSESVEDLPPFLLYHKVAHSDNVLELAFKVGYHSTIPQSLGIREIILTFSNETLTQINTCGVAPYSLNAFNAVGDPDNACPCQSLTMNATASFCAGCDESCLYCNKPGSSGCIACHSGSYLTTEGKCALCTSNCGTCSGQSNICTTCKAGYFLVGTSCYQECPKPLNQVQIGPNWFCQSNCKSTEYAYWDGTKTVCLASCNIPSLVGKTIASYKVCAPCGQDEYLETTSSGSSCKSKNLAGQFSLKIEVDNVLTEVTFVDKNLQADNARFSLFGKEYTVNPSWTFFGLKSVGEYSIDNWDTSSSCGCFKQVCGKDCAAGVECHDNSDQKPSSSLICNADAKRNNYCWSLRNVGTQKFTSYMLNHISTIALTSYGGPDGVFVSPGFTISSSVGGGKQVSALNALIMNFTPRIQVDLASSYRYAENEGRVVTTQYLASINTPPKITADLKVASCNSTTVNLPLYLTYEKQEKAPTFHAYTILRRAEIPKLSYLNNQDILSPTGVLEWNNQDTFDILDPCNQQFLTLRRDNIGNFFVNLPEFQTLSNSNSVICIAVNDIPSSQYDLVLYELINGTSTWSASDRFAGLISKDYVDELTFRIATKADSILSVPSHFTIKTDFHIDVDSPYVLITTSTPTTCRIDLSPTCSFDISTSSEFLFGKHFLSNCGLLYEKAGYNCQGVVGYFYPPNSLVKTPISQFTENTTAIKCRNKNFSFIKATFSQQDLISGLFSVNFWTRWSWESAPTKLCCALIIFSVCLFLVMAKDIFRSLKKWFSRGKGYRKLSNESKEEETHKHHDLYEEGT